MPTLALTCATSTELITPFAFTSSRKFEPLIGWPACDLVRLTSEASRRYFNTGNIREWQTKNVRGDSGQVVSGRPNSLGRTKGRPENGPNDHSQEKRRDYGCWTKEAFPTDESSMGSKAKIR